MNLLAIETTGPQLSVALINEEGKITERMADPGFNHLTNLVPMIDQITKDCALALDDVTAISVSQGPGSFTGIRIGVSTARALAQALNKPTVGVPTLESFVYHAPDFRGVICPMFDARRNQVYAGAFQSAPAGDKAGHEKLTYSTLVAGGAYELDEYLSKLEAALEDQPVRIIMLFGDGLKPYGEKVKEWAGERGIAVLDSRDLAGKADSTVSVLSDVQRAASVARLAKDIFESGKTLEYGQLQPDYMRLAEAERKRKEN